MIRADGASVHLSWRESPLLAPARRALRDGADRDIHVAVRDSGLGQTPATTAHVSEACHTTKLIGLNFGLSIRCSIIEAHGGRSWVTAKASRGMIFQWTLPAHPVQS